MLPFGAVWGTESGLQVCSFFLFSTVLAAYKYTLRYERFQNLPERVNSRLIRRMNEINVSEQGTRPKSSKPSDSEMTELLRSDEVNTVITVYYEQYGSKCQLAIKKLGALPAEFPLAFLEGIYVAREEVLARRHVGKAESFFLYRVTTEFIDLHLHAKQVEKPGEPFESGITDYSNWTPKDKHDFFKQVKTIKSCSYFKALYKLLGLPPETESANFEKALNALQEELELFGNVVCMRQVLVRSLLQSYMEKEADDYHKKAIRSHTKSAFERKLSSLIRHARDVDQADGWAGDAYVAIRDLLGEGHFIVDIPAYADTILRNRQKGKPLPDDPQASSEFGRDDKSEPEPLPIYSKNALDLVLKHLNTHAQELLNAKWEAASETTNFEEAKWLLRYDKKNLENSNRSVVKQRELDLFDQLLHTLDALAGMLETERDNTNRNKQQVVREAEPERVVRLESTIKNQMEELRQVASKKEDVLNTRTEVQQEYDPVYDAKVLNLNPDWRFYGRLYIRGRIYATINAAHGAWEQVKHQIKETAARIKQVYDINHLEP